METRRRKNSSGDKFSFPTIIPIQLDPSDQEFEFGCFTTPSSPNSPADHLFSNGRLLPHPFPFPPPTTAASSFPRSTSRTSSVSSKDSLMSSRSNSTNSSSSSSSSCTTSARTSTSSAEPSEKKVQLADRLASLNKLAVKCDNKIGKGVSVQQNYGGGSCSRRWGLILAAPVLSHQVSGRRKKGEVVVVKEGKKKVEDKTWIVRRFLRWFVSACKKCHAIEPPRRDDELRENMELQ